MPGTPPVEFRRAASGPAEAVQLPQTDTHADEEAGHEHNPADCIEAHLVEHDDHGTHLCTHRHNAQHLGAHQKHQPKRQQHNRYFQPTIVKVLHAGGTRSISATSAVGICSTGRNRRQRRRRRGHASLQDGAFSRGNFEPCAEGEQHERGELNKVDDLTHMAHVRVTPQGAPHSARRVKASFALLESGTDWQSL
eukprot:3668679-Prymnesium_polylepis.1